MNVPELSERQQRLAGATLSAATGARQSAAARGGAAPAPGDRYVLRETADLPVEWVLLERHPQRAAFLAVPADTHPFVGGADVELPAGSAAGALRLRLAFPAWIATEQLPPELRVGAIDEITLAKARQKVREAGATVSSPTEDDELAEYQDWLREAIAPARAAAGSSEPAPRPQPRLGLPGRTRRPWLALAAAVLLLAAAGLTGLALIQGRQLSRLAEGKRTVEGALAQEQANRERAIAEQQAGARQLAERIERQSRDMERLQDRLAELEKGGAKLPEAVLNAPIAILNSTERVRGEEPKVVRIDPVVAPYLTIVLNLDDNTPYANYRALVTRHGSATPVWKDDRLERKGHGIQFALDRRRVPPDSYHFQVFGLRGAQANPLAEYDLIINR